MASNQAILLSVALTLTLFLGLSYGQVGYGELCNGLLRQCNRYSETVLCMSRVRNETVGGEVCGTGAGVDVGRCQCRMNCAANGTYILQAEFDEERQKCVGFVGRSCQVFPDCVKNAHCEPVMRVCRCNEGFVPDAEGLRCVPQ